MSAFAYDGSSAPVDVAAFRQVMSRFATGVTVVTTSNEGKSHGMTVNSLTSVSLDPLLVLFCCLRSAVLHDPLLASGEWAVSLLGSDQEQVARCFTKREHEGDDQFAPWPIVPGAVVDAPLIGGAIGYVECRTWATYDGGDHTIVVGEVLDVDLGRDTDALLYFNRKYGTLGA